MLHAGIERMPIAWKSVMFNPTPHDTFKIYVNVNKSKILFLKFQYKSRLNIKLKGWVIFIKQQVRCYPKRSIIIEFFTLDELKHACREQNIENSRSK